MLIALRFFLLGSFRSEYSLPIWPTRGKNEVRGRKDVNKNNKRSRGSVKHGTFRARMPTIGINGTVHVSRMSSKHSDAGLPCSEVRIRKASQTHQYDIHQRATTQQDLIILPRRTWT